MLDGGSRVACPELDQPHRRADRTPTPAPATGFDVREGLLGVGSGGGLVSLVCRHQGEHPEAALRFVADRIQLARKVAHPQGVLLRVPPTTGTELQLGEEPADRDELALVVRRGRPVALVEDFTRFLQAADR